MPQILTSVRQPEITDKTRIRPTALRKFVLKTKLKAPNIFFSTAGKKVAGAKKVASATESCSRRIRRAPGLVENTEL